MHGNAARSYEQTSFFTADPLKLVLMCYEGAILHLKAARDSYAAKDYELKGRELQKALDIIDELNANLDMKKGGVVAANLRSLYTYMTQALISADLRRDIAVFDDVIRMLEELESSWKQIAVTSTKRAIHEQPQPTGILRGLNTGSTVLARVWSV